MKSHKYSIWISFFLMVIILIYYIISFKSVLLVKQERRFYFKIPKVPSLVKYVSIPKNGLEHLAIGIVWGINALREAASANLTKRNLRFVFKRFNGKDSVCLISDCSYRWELQGISYVFGDYSAFFYNPKLKKSKLVISGELLDSNLKVLKVSDEKVMLEFKLDNISYTFTLKIFDINFRPKNGGKK